MVKILYFLLSSILIFPWQNLYTEEITPITIAILAKDKEHTLPLYLSCIENQTWPKEKTFLYIRTNNNNDKTAQILHDWVEKVGSSYAGIQFDDSDLAEQVQQYKQHEWNGIRFKVLAKIRQDSVQWAKNQNSHYFVVDCDNFIQPHTLETLVKTDLPIVAPLLKVAEPRPYSNYHAAIDKNGYYASSPYYEPILNLKIRGLIELPVVHCAYFIRKDVLDNIVYDDESGRYEYVIFSDHARKKNIPQYLDNREVYGYITFAENKEDFDKEPWLYKFLSKNEKMKETFTHFYKKGIWAKDQSGKGTSGEGSTETNTVEYRNFLQNFLKNNHIRSVVDAGCGNWEFSHLIDWKGISYKGYDIVKHVIEENNKLYATDTIKFFNENFLNFNLPKEDLFIAKDVFQHLSNQDILSFLPQLEKYKYCLLINDTTNSSHSQNDVHIDVVGYRNLDLTKPPFNLKGERIFMFKSGLVFKEVFLIKN